MLFKKKIPWYETSSKMSKTILPLIKLFKNKERHGWPAGLDTPEQWEEIIDKILFSLEWHAGGENDDDCYVPNPYYNPEQKEAFSYTPSVDGRFTKLHSNKDWGEMTIDMNLLNKKHERIMEGFRLLGEYWLSFWD